MSISPANSNDELIWQHEWFVRFQKESTREAAFNELIVRFQQKIYGHLRRMLKNHDDADEALQLTFIKAWKGLDNFRSDSKLYTWLYRIATNEALNIIRQKAKGADFSFDDEDSFIAEPRSSSTNLSPEKVERWLTEAIETLPPKQQLVFNLKYYEELKFEEMAEVTGTSVGALKASYHHAVRKIEVFVLNKLNH